MAERVPETTLSRNHSTFGPIVRIMRIDHWFKNVFIVPGVMFALLADPKVVGPGLVWSLTIGVIAVCLAASSNYVINEVLDARRDRLHPDKRDRPIPSGQVTVPLALALWIGLGIASVLPAFLVNRQLGLSILALLVAGLLYNLPPIRTKDLPYLDVISEAVNNPIRMLIGWYATGCTLMPPLSLLMSYWALGAFLMAIKRFAEYRHLASARRAAAYRPSFRHYNEARLLVSTMCYATACAMFAGIFIGRYRLELVLTVPAFAIFMALYLRLGLKPDSPTQHPERLLRRRSMILSGIGLTAIVAFSLWLDSPRLRALFEPTITPQAVESQASSPYAEPDDGRASDP